MYDPARGYPNIVPYLTYPDVEDAVRWLVHVFGFKEHIRLTPGAAGPPRRAAPRPVAS